MCCSLVLCGSLVHVPDLHICSWHSRDAWLVFVHVLGGSCVCLVRFVVSRFQCFRFCGFLVKIALFPYIFIILGVACPSVCPYKRS